MKEFIMQYWIEAVFGATLTGLGIAYKKLLGKFKKQDTMEMGLQALLRNAIIQSYNRHIDMGYCPIYEKENVEKMYEQYHALGGNGTITKLYEELMGMSTETPMVTN